MNSLQKSHDFRHDIDRFHHIHVYQIKQASKQSKRIQQSITNKPRNKQTKSPTKPPNLQASKPPILQTGDGGMRGAFEFAVPRRGAWACFWISDPSRVAIFSVLAPKMEPKSMLFWCQSQFRVKFVDFSRTCRIYRPCHVFLRIFMWRTRCFHSCNFWKVPGKFDSCIFSRIPGS